MLYIDMIFLLPTNDDCLLPRLYTQRGRCNLSLPKYFGVGRAASIELSVRDAYCPLGFGLFLFETVFTVSVFRWGFHSPTKPEQV